MPQHSPEVIKKVRELRQDGKSQGAVSRLTGVPQPTISRWENDWRRISAENSAESAALAPIEPGPVDRPNHHETVQRYALPSAEALANHETRLQVLESFVKALQEQAQQVPVQHITVQPSAYALPSAETVQSWDDPEDAKPERWNLWLPRGIKRRIEAQAKAAGIAPSQLVQRLLTNAMQGKAVDTDA